MPRKRLKGDNLSRSNPPQTPTSFQTVESTSSIESSDETLADKQFQSGETVLREPPTLAVKQELINEYKLRPERRKVVIPNTSMAKSPIVITLDESDGENEMENSPNANTRVMSPEEVKEALKGGFVLNLNKLAPCTSVKRTSDGRASQFSSKKQVCKILKRAFFIGKALYFLLITNNH